MEFGKVGSWERDILRKREFGISRKWDFEKLGFWESEIWEAEILGKWKSGILLIGKVVFWYLGKWYFWIWESGILGKRDFLKVGFWESDSFGK